MSDPPGRKQTADERKLARAKRVTDKKLLLSGGGAAVSSTSASVEEAMVSKQQILATRILVDADRYAAEESASDVQVDRNDSENQRRRKEEGLRRDRHNQVRMELQESQITNQEIEDAWTEVAKKSQLACTRGRAEEEEEDEAGAGIVHTHANESIQDDARGSGNHRER
jgi:hypothetical protein